MKTLINKYDKDLIPGLPRVLFPGRIEVVLNLADTKKAVKSLMTPNTAPNGDIIQPILGFDTETRPSFSRKHPNKVALLQVCRDNICYLFRLNYIGFPLCLQRLLEDDKIIKVGLSWNDDVRALNTRHDFKSGKFVELQKLAGEMGLKDKSLQKLYANFFKQRISKAQTMSNWDAEYLTDAQMKYAATDAWACVRLYEEMMKLKREGYFLEVRPEVEPQKSPISH